MNIFAGNITLEDSKEIPELDFDVIQVGEKSYFIMGADPDLKSIEEICHYLETQLGKIVSHDVSLEWKDALEILSSEYEDGVYECVSFEWAEVSFSAILERFAESSEVMCVREAEVSEKFWNRIIKVDFIY